MNNDYRPYTLIAELTYRCPLRCPYCSNPVDYARHQNEIDTNTWLRVFHEAEALGVVQVNLTGGEPLLRDDLEILVEGAGKLGVRRVKIGRMVRYVASECRAWVENIHGQNIRGRKAER